MDALAKANDIRITRARKLNQLFDQPSRDGCFTAARWLEHPERWLEPTPVYRLLVKIRRVGPSKARTMLRHAQVDPFRRVGDLTDRQRRALVVELRCKEWR
jgi:hypothetical protein